MENYLISERRKKMLNNLEDKKLYFWRSYEKKEIDLVENISGALHGFEFKWSGSKIPKSPTLYTNLYPDASFEVINRDNYLDFI